MTTDPHDMNTPDDPDDTNEPTYANDPYDQPYEADDPRLLPPDSERGYEIVEVMIENLFEIIHKAENEIKGMTASPRSTLDVLDEIDRELADLYVRAIYLHGGAHEMRLMLNQMMDEQQRLPIPFDNDSISQRAFEQGWNARTWNILSKFSFEGRQMMIRWLEARTGDAGQYPGESAESTLDKRDTSG